MSHTVRHMSTTSEHYTPPHIIEAARLVLGVIDLDPASCERAQRFVRAKRWIGRPEDGLQCRWVGRTFLNPPGGVFLVRRKKKTDPKPRQPRADVLHEKRWQTNSRAVAWWRKLVLHYEAGHVPEAIFIGFNLDILQTTQGKGLRDPLHFSICVPSERLEFGGTSPTHANVIIYLGGKKAKFEKVFERFGTVKL